MKKKLTIAFSLILIILSAVCFVACSGADEEVKKGLAPGWEMYNDNITYRLSYTSEEECPGGNISDSKLHSAIDFATDKVYYMAVDFTISSFNVNGWNNDFNCSVTVAPSSIIDATLEEANTGKYTEKQDGGGTRITTTYSIPENKKKERSYRIIVQFTFKAEGLVNIDLMFYGDKQNEYSFGSAEKYIGNNVTAGFEYELNEDRLSYSVVGLGKAAEKDIIIPSVRRGLIVNTIADDAFKWGSNLTSITISEAVSSIGALAFSGCTSLESFTVKEDNAVYHSDGNCVIETESKKLIAGCKNSVIPDDGSVIRIGDSAFRNRSGLTIITIPNSVISIGHSAFYGCSRLTSIKLSDKVAYFGNYTFYGCKSLTSITLPNSLTSVGNYSFHGCGKLESITFGNKLSAIGSCAFWFCRSLTSVKIPDSVTYIGKHAFYGCSGLNSISIPGGVTSIEEAAFGSCSRLGSISVPFIGASKNSSANTHFGYIFGAKSYSSNSNYVPTSLKTVVITGGTAIGDYAFWGCDGLINITISGSVTSIGKGILSGCTGLESISIAGDNEAYRIAGDCIIATNSQTLIAGCKNSIIPSDGSVKSIGPSAFEGCGSLASITIPNSVKTIGASAFAGCNRLNRITIPDSVTTIGESAFKDCVGFTSIIIPKNVTSIGFSAFEGCNGLKSATVPFVGTKKDSLFHAHIGYMFGADSYSDNSDFVPASLKTVTITGGSTIDNNAFLDCNNITSVTIPESVTKINYSAFEGCSSLTDITIPAGVNDIGNSAFKDCSSLTSITIPYGVTYITTSTFNGCGSLASVTIPNSVTTIGDSAFRFCSSLKNITIPDSVTKIRDIVFWGCSSLTSITIPEAVTSIGYSVFYNCNSLKNVTFKNTVGWRVSVASDMSSAVVIDSGDLIDSVNAANLFKNKYGRYYWQRS